MWSQVEEVGKKSHPNSIGKTIQYGTAGFRTKADILDHVMYRMGVMAVLRSKKKQATIGVMITASHNPEQDNGVKLVDPKGEMLEQSWESLATQVANAEDSKLGEVLDVIVKDQGIQVDNSAQVFVGRDTRSSSPKLAEAVIDGINATNGTFRDFGIVSTPQLHFNVVCENSGGSYGTVGKEGYFTKLSNAFKHLRGQNPKNGNYSPVLKFDGANGVGAQVMKEMLPHLGSTLEMEILNDGTKPGDVLNSQCGADFVKVQQKPSAGMEKIISERCVAVDGDADRVMYFFNDENGKFNMLDGDKIATLIAGYMKDQVTLSKLPLNLGIVQTAYANGSSTKFIKENLDVPVACVPTGVKHLHHRALDFDIGVYFEANGHGTVVFGEAAEAKIREAAKANNEGAKNLANIIDVINQTVGDAISDMLLVETILHAKGWSAQDWSKSYKDFPNRLMKVRVKDRNVIVVFDAERQVEKPEVLQGEINKIVQKFPNGRSFVRPSGTEDVVRVYAEADTQDNANQLAYEVGLKVHELAGGIGEPTPRPT